MTYELHSNIPAPEARSAGRPAAVKYPFADMQVNQSFFEPSAATEDKVLADVQSAQIDRLRSAAARWRKTSGNNAHQFRVDVYADGSGNAFVGCWRVA